MNERGEKTLGIIKTLFKKKLFPQILLCIGFAILLSFSMQIASLKPYHLSSLFWAFQHTGLYALSALLVFLVILGLGALFNNLYLGMGFSALVIAAVDCIQYYKIKMLGEPIYPWDLQLVRNLREMVKIAGNIVSPLCIIVAAVLGIAALIGTYWLPRYKMKLPVRFAFVLPSVLAVVACTHLQDPVMAKSLEKAGAVDYHWNQEQNYLENGLMFGFLENIGVKIQNRPADYSEQAMEQIIQKYSGNGGEANSGAAGEQPNIVYMMDESLFDPTRLTNLSFSEDPMANMHRDKNLYASGYSLSPVFGGGTSNVEFEALTGMNMTFMNEGAVPYQQALAGMDSFPSIVSLLKSRGYVTTAIHPFDKTFYNRNKVYPVLGFDQFISQDTIKYTDRLSSSGFISDMSAVKEVIDVLNDGDQPHFVHLVTMQNHLPIMEGMNGPNTIRVKGLDEGTTTEMESYTQSVKETDKAVQYLVDAIRNIKRPTIVVVFGDHLPALSDSIYTKFLTGKPAAQQEQFRHETPLLVAANFKLPERQLGTLAPSFFGPLVFDLAGLPLPPYYQMLETIRTQLPGISPSVYVNADGTPSLSLTADQKNMLHDYELIQYDLLYGNGYAKTLFQ